jgi:hypothetical protein
MIVKTFTEPTDIVLIGESEIRLDEKGEKEWHADFLITDDECTITLISRILRWVTDSLCLRMTHRRAEREKM